MEIFNAVLPIFLIIGLGFAIKISGFVPDTFTNYLNRFVYYISLPALLFYSIANISFVQYFNLKLIFAMICAVTMCILLALIYCYICKLELPKAASFTQGVFRGNVVYIGFVVCLYALGAKALEEAAIIVGFFVPLTNMMAIITLMLFGRQGNRCSTVNCLMVEIFKNPIVLSCVMGIFVSSVGLPIPSVINNTLNIISKTALPLALITVGSSIQWPVYLGDINVVFVASFAKLVMLPVLGILFFTFLGISGIDAGIGVILLACPTAVSTFVLAKELGADTEVASSIITVSTLFSLISLTGWAWFAMYL